VRTLSGAERTLIGGSRFDVHLRAFIRDAGGTFRDLTNVHGARNWLLGVTIRESLDSPSATASVTLSRTEGGLSIAPGVSGSSGPRVSRRALHRRRATGGGCSGGAWIGSTPATASGSRSNAATCRAA